MHPADSASIRSPFSPGVRSENSTGRFESANARAVLPGIRIRDLAHCGEGHVRPSRLRLVGHYLFLTAATPFQSSKSCSGFSSGIVHRERFPSDLLNVHLNAFVPQPRCVPGGVSYVADHNTAELPHIEERCAHVARAERCENSCHAKIVPPGVAEGGGFAMVVRMVFLYQSVVSFPKIRRAWFSMITPPIGDLSSS